MESTRGHSHDSGQFVGSGVVAGASYGSRTTVLQIQTFVGEYIDFTVGGVPDPAGAAEFLTNDLRPISIRIQHGGEQCSVIALAADGPRRSKVSLGTALALHQSGVYAVVDGGLQFGMPCSTQNAKRRRPLS